MPATLKTLFIPTALALAAALPLSANADTSRNLGWIEQGVIEPADMTVKFKLDTGALTSSMHAEDIERFERDGQPWVRFKVALEDLKSESIISETFERPLERDLRVRGAGRRTATDDPDFGEIVSSAELSTHAGWADHLILAAPLTDATRGLVDGQVLAAMKPDAHLVNIARGPMVDEDALLDALTTHQIGGATLDVFDTEPLPPDHPLWDAPNVTITAHMSADVVGWRDELAAQFAANARRWLAGEDLHNVVDKKLGYIPGGQ